jgi:hypothetical protein
MFVSLRERTREFCARYLVVTQLVLRRWPNPSITGERTRSSVGFATYLLPLPGEPCGRIKRPKAPAVIANHSEYFLKE